MKTFLTVLGWSIAVACGCGGDDMVVAPGAGAPGPGAPTGGEEPRIDAGTNTEPGDAAVPSGDEITPGRAVGGGVFDAPSEGAPPPPRGQPDGSSVPRFACPAGPFAAPAVVATKSVCADFGLRYNWSEGPTWVASERAFFFSNFTLRSPTGGDIIKYTPGAGCETFVRDVGCNGLTVGPDGSLLAACQQSRSVVKFDLVSKQATTLVDNYQGMMLDSPNDLVVHSNGTIYFTNPTYELGSRPPGIGPAIFRLDPSGALDLIAQSPCNGIALSPDERRLYVLLAGVWDVAPSGEPTNRTDLFTGGDGMAVDCAGNIYASGRIFDATGQRLGDYGTGTNLAFGGEDGTTVLVAGPGSQVRELQMTVPGLR